MKCTFCHLPLTPETTRRLPGLVADADGEFSPGDVPYCVTCEARLRDQANPLSPESDAAIDDLQALLEPKEQP